MKKSYLLFAVILVVVISLQNCHPDRPVQPQNPNDPDSLYVGTPYSFTSINPPIFSFPSIRNPYADSVTLEGIQLGRRLFYDKHLSSTGLLACASCHKQQFAFSDQGNAKSTNVFGPTKRNAPSIENMLWVPRLFFDGRSNSLAEQAKDAFHGEQNMDIPGSIAYLKTDSTYIRLFKKAFGRPGTITEPEIYLAVQQFGMTLISYRSPFDIWRSGGAYVGADADSGFAVFGDPARGDCFHCHMFGNTLLMTDNGFHNNGLDYVDNVNNYTDLGRGGFINYPDSNGYFKAPSLRNVALTAPYMHDGRFATLMDVLNFYSDSVQKPVNFDGNMFLSTNPTNKADGRRRFTAQEKQYLIAFFNSLTDTAFTNNPAFKSPF